jgi:hypothetical protein
MLFPADLEQGAMTMRAFTQHPASVGESYFVHLASAWGFAFCMAAGAAACLLHGLFPFAFQKSGSRRICDLHERMVANRRRHEDAGRPAQSA